MELRWLGDTGVRVSAFALGTMGFGDAARGGWVGSIEQADADRQVAMALDAGVNLFDTANVYGAGNAEILLGRALGDRRDDVIVSTKVHSRSGPGPNDVGQSRWHIVRACEASLRRLGTDRIDLYHVHGFDACTPLEETLEGLNDLVRSGKVRYLACSNLAAWQVMKALGISREQRWSRFVAYQGYYSLVGRDIEHDVLAMCRDQHLGVLVWSPLAGGFLTGKFRRGEAGPDASRRTRVGDLGVGRIDEERGFAIVEVAEAIAAARGVSVAQVALNWLRTRPEVTSIIIGARTDAQLADNLAAAGWTLRDDERVRLDQASEVDRPYPHWFHHQFTGERYSREGPPPGAFDYRFRTEPSVRGDPAAP